MALPPESLALLETAFEALPAPVKEIFNANTPGDTADAITSLVAKKRRESMADNVGGVVSASVSNWGTLETLAEVADSATLYPAVAAFNVALTARNAKDLFTHAIVSCLAIKKNLGV